jgi:hypothetical protein
MTARYFSLVLSIGLLSGCAGSAVETHAASRGARATSIQAVEDNDTAEVAAAPPKIANRFQSLLDEALYEENHFRRGPDLTIKWRLIGYHEGSRALRYMVGFGAGQGKISVQARFIDQRGKEVGAVKGQGSITMGAFGGSYETALSKCADAIGDYAAKTFGSGVR